jgi:RNA polymerase sigma-54 factor
MTVMALELTPRLEQRASPELIAYAELLAMPAFELAQTIRAELERNPALELVERDVCGYCGAALERGPCRACARRARREDVRPAGDRISARRTPAEALIEELRPLLEPAAEAVLEHVVWSLDERGFLDAEPREIAARLRVDIGAVLGVVELVRQNGPPGVAARSLSECLLLQLDRIDGGDEGTIALARAIAERHLDDLAASRFRAIAQAEGTTAKNVVAAAELIRTRLRPYASLDEPEHAGDPPPALPDIVVRETEDRLAVELIEERRLGLTVSPAYAAVDASALDTSVRTQVESQVAAAQSFELRLRRRWQTMRLIAEETIARQRDYVLHGPSRLKPLTRGEIAAAIGVHESTVSRAVAGRYVLLPSRQVVPFSRFFDAAQAPCAALAQIVADETTPQSDADLAEELAQLGFAVARRTVAKYRALLGIPPHTRR